MGDRPQGFHYEGGRHYICHKYECRQRCQSCKIVKRIWQGCSGMWSQKSKRYQGTGQRCERYLFCSGFLESYHKKPFGFWIERQSVHFCKRKKSGHHRWRWHRKWLCGHIYPSRRSQCDTAWDDAESAGYESGEQSVAGVAKSLQDRLWSGGGDRSIRTWPTYLSDHGKRISER